ncbi:MAG: NAD(+) diphosphatase [Muribaculaceae bacterium]|nr:NAD(+) diphosphatase [Muribaculaceae bacterium]
MKRKKKQGKLTAMNDLIITGSSRLMLMNEKGKLRLPHEGEVSWLPEAEKFLFPGYIVLSLKDIDGFPSEAVEYGLRESWSILPSEKYKAAAKGAALVNWNDSERFCPLDGTPLLRNSEISKCCPTCGREYFPRLSPAIVVLVLRGEEALLVHASTLKNPEVMTLVAGYVETGETLEECVRREIKEETDLDVADIRYFGSQAWPYPNQLMMGFTARYAGGILRFADGEITAGDFFTRDNIPVIPTMPSLSRVIIEAWRDGKFSEIYKEC